MPFYRYLESGLYSVLDLLPYVLIAYYPVRNKLRIPKWAVVPSLVLLCIVECLRTYCIMVGGNPILVTPITLIIYAVFYLLAVKQSPWKGLFALLCLANISFFNDMLAKCIESLLFPSMALQQDRWSFSLCLTLIELLVLIPLYYYVKRIYTPAMERDKKETAWRLLWCVPATFYLAWYVYVEVNQVPMLDMLSMPQLALLQLAIMCGSFLIYHSIIRLVDAQNTNEALLARDHQYRMQLSQYRDFRDRVVETKKARHDLRHHLNVIASYARDENHQDLLAYLHRCENLLNDHTLTLYCDNYPVNALLRHFAARADNAGCPMQVNVALPEEVPIPNEVLAVLFGNLLENAVEAVEGEPEKGEISVSCRMDWEFLFLNISNTCTRDLQFGKSGNPVSTKGDDQAHGIGLRSVRDIVRQYDGMMEITNEGGLFEIRIMLPLGKDQ